MPIFTPLSPPPSFYFYIFNPIILQHLSGKAVRQTPEGECEERAYTDGRLVSVGGGRELFSQTIFCLPHAFSLILSTYRTAAPPSYTRTAPRRSGHTRYVFDKNIIYPNFNYASFLYQNNRLLGPATLFAANGHRLV